MLKLLKRNIGDTDRSIRIVLGVIAAILAAYYNSLIFGIVAAVFIITALTRFCGLYKLLGINTSKI